MKVTLLALNLLAAAASASMAEDFVSNLNVSATTSDSVQNEPKDGQRRRIKTVLRGTAKHEYDTIDERELKDNKDDKDDKNDKNNDGETYQGSNSFGMTYFVPSYPGKAHKSDFDGKFDLGYNVRPGPSKYYESSDNKHTRPLNYDDRDDKTPSYSKDKKDSYAKPDKKEDYHSKLTYSDKEKAEEVNVSFTEKTYGRTDTPEPTVGTANPTVSPTWSPSLEPTYAKESRVSAETGAPTFDETVDPTLQPTLQPTGMTASPTFDELTGSPTFDERADPTLKPTALLTGSPTFDETNEPTVAAVDEETSTSSTEVITTTGWQPDETSNVTWNYNGKPERTRPPSTPEPTQFVSTAAPSIKGSSVSPTLSPSIATNDPTMMPSSTSVVSTDAPVSAVDSTNSTTSTNSPSFYPTYFPTTSNTTSPTFYEASTATTTTEAATNGTSPGGFDCTTEFCEYQLSDAYLMEYRLNVPEGESVDQCQTCSLSVRLTYEGEAWLGFAFSTDGQMIGSEAVIANPMLSSEPGKYILGGKYDGAILPMEDNKQTLTDANIEIVDGFTVMTFTKLLKEEGEIEIYPGDNTFLWAHGSDTESTYHGNNKSPFQLNLMGSN